MGIIEEISIKVPQKLSKELQDNLPMQFPQEFSIDKPEKYLRNFSN